MAGLSQRAFARLAGVSQPSVKQAAREGRLSAEGGKLDPVHPVNAAYIAARAPGLSGAPVGTAAQIAALVAKARLRAHDVEKAEADYFERATLADEWAEHARMIREWLATIPERCAIELAAELDRPVDVAHAGLGRFKQLLLAETARLEAEARDVIMRL